MSDKTNSVENDYIRLKSLACSTMRKGKFSSTLAAVSALGYYLYKWNQHFKDNDLEDILSGLSKVLVKPTFGKFDCNSNTIIFYDSFGGDVRGLLIIYLKALCDLGFNIVYVTQEKSKGKQPELHKAVAKGHVIWEYIPTYNSLKKLTAIVEIFEKHKPANAFLYATPWDAPAISVFDAYANIVNRYQINLTDHTFWLGIRAFDYCIEFRNIGATLSFKQRGLEKKQLIKLPYYPYIDKTIPFEGLPAKIGGKKILFSGGDITKTQGDKNHLFYKMVEEILIANKDTAFLYAGRTCDDLESLMSKFKDRVTRINERKDLYQLMKHCTVYLNTFPQIGGLMTQYAAIAGKLPLTLIGNENHDLDGILLNHNKYKIEFYDYKDLVYECNRILQDDKYRKEKETLMQDAVISSEEFQCELQKVLQYNRNDFNVNTELEYDGEDLHKWSINNFNPQQIFMTSLVFNKELFPYFPVMYINHYLKRFL